MDRPLPNGGRPLLPQSAGSQSSNLSRAQRFESEKERISESCFAKLDENGQRAESYITHLRVEEDAMYPSTPPPRDSPADQKKPRVIIVAVRNTGRVRMHKARENQGGSFSIGKTWNLEDLTVIESFNHVAPNADKQRRIDCERAGSLGFVVTLVKPYYWTATTARERDFFISSLVKIYKKYTRGREPRLVGFSDQEKEAMVGVAPQAVQTPPVSQSMPPPPLPPPPSQPESTPPLSAFTQSQYSRSSINSRDPHPRVVSSDRFGPASSPALSNGRRVPSSDFMGARPPSSNAYPAQDRRPDQGLGLGGYVHEDRPRQASVEALRTPGLPDPLASTRSSRSEMRPLRPESPVTSVHTTYSGTTAASGRTRPASPGISRTQYESPNGDDARANSIGARDRWQPVSLPASASTDPPTPLEYRQDPGAADSAHFIPDTQALPERRRPPMLQQPPHAQEPPEFRPSPLSTGRTPSDRKLERMPGAFNETPISEARPSPRFEHRYNESPTTAPIEEPKPYMPSPKPTPRLLPEPAPADEEPITPKDEDLEGYRPGLGPMVKKKNAANQFRKAAKAVNAFKPRARAGQDTLKIDTKDDAKAPSRNVSYDVSQPEVVNRNMMTPASTDYTVALQTDFARDESTQIESAPEPARPKTRSRQQEKYLAGLGLDPMVLNDKGIDFETTLTDFGWSDGLVEAKMLDILQADIKREIGRVEVGSWLGHLDQKDERVELVDKLLDKTIAECDELDGLLTIYGVELGSLNDDISFIEAQSQGLQVQTANQKILQSEMQTLIGTISMDTRQLQALQRGSFDTDMDLMEETLVSLFKAMLTLDPTRNEADKTKDGKSDDNAERTQLANMNALQEKRLGYEDESMRFASRLKSRLEVRFTSTLNNAIPALLKQTGLNASWQIQPPACNALRTELWRYSPMLLFAKEMARPTWVLLGETYSRIAAPLYESVYRNAIEGHKKLLRVPTGEESEFLFTHVEKDVPEGLAASATRKLTMKKSQTLAKAVRTTSSEKAGAQPGRKMPYEMVNDMLSSWAPAIVMEQNFVVKLFHATSLENLEFVDAIGMQPPDARGEPVDLKLPMRMDPDRQMAEHVTKILSVIFSFLPEELRSLLDLASTDEPLQSIGILASIAVYSFPLHERSTEFLLRCLNEASTRLRTVFSKFIDDQIRAIEDTKVKIKKRKGVISFVRVFPLFSMSIENMFSSVTRVAGPNASVLEVRRMIDDAYERICQSMWSSLKQIAKDSPSTTGVGTEAEDKEVLNYNVLLVENFNHIANEVEAGDYEDTTLGKWRAKALQEREEHLDMYLRQVIRRPLGKLLDFVESTEALLKECKEKSTQPRTIAARPSHSRAAAKKALSGYDGREIRKGIDVLRKRIEKHFSEGFEAEDAGTMQRLIAFVVDETASEYEHVLDRLERIDRKVYAVEGEKGLEIEWSREDVAAGFKK